MKDIQEIEAFASESGNNFHCSVVNAVKGDAWNVLISPYYMDAATDKPRELDLIAEKFWVHNSCLGAKNGAIVLKLFIECKYIAQPTVFWFGKKDTSAATEWLITNTPLRKDNIFTQQHHYLASCPKVAKLFASMNKPNIENEAMYKALNQSLNALIYLRGRESLNSDLQSGRIQKLAEVEMPVIVCNSFSEFYEVGMDSPGTPKQIDDNFQLEVKYAYIDRRGNRQSEYFLIDVVAFDKLAGYFSTLLSDKMAISRIL